MRIKIGRSLRNFYDRIRASVGVRKKNIVFFAALFLVVLLAIMIRLTPIFRDPIMIREFDPNIQYYNAKYIVEHSLYDYFHWIDKKSWYPGGVKRANIRPGLPFTAAVIYFILNFFGIPVTILEVCFYLPAFFGGLTVLAAYFLGKEIYDRNCGLFAAFFLAFNPGHMQRTIAGSFDNETVGVFAMLIVFVFFLKAMKSGKFSHSITGGIFLGYLALSWGAYEFVFYIIPIVSILLILLNKYNENVLIAYAGILGTGFLIFSLFYANSPSNFLSNYQELTLVFSTLIILLFHFIYTKKNNNPRFYNIFLNSIKWLIIPSIIIGAVIIWVRPDIIPISFGARFDSILSPLLREKFNLVASVAEHMPSAWSVFYYNSLISLILLPLGFFFCFKRMQAADILLMIFLLLIFYFTGSMIRIILVFAPAASLMASYGLVNVLKIYGTFVGERKLSISRKRKRQLRRKKVGNSEVFAVYLLVGFLCIAQVYNATDVSINQLSYSPIVAGGQYHDWEDALTWMRNNLAGTDVVASWWDYGYWITPLGNVTSVCDNSTHDGKRIGLVGMAYMQTNEIFSAKIFRELKADYVLVYFGFLIAGLGGDEGKWPWMLRICNDNYELYKEDNLEEDNWASGSVFDEAEYINNTSGLYEDKWFDSQLVRLMFYGEKTDPGSINPNTQYLQWYYASQIGGNTANNIQSREDDNGNEWAEHIPANGYYDFKVFKPVYFSTNHMVKIYKVDYTALESSFSIENPKVYNTKAATFDLLNTGTKDVKIESVKVNNIECNFTLGRSNADKILSTNEVETVWADLSTAYNVYDTVNIAVTAEADAYGGTKYVFNESTNDFFVTSADYGSIRINKENSKVEQIEGDKANIYLEVENDGDYTVNLKEFYVNNEANKYNATNYVSGSSVLKPGNKASVYIQDVQGKFNPENGIFGNMIGVKTSHGVKAEMLMSYNVENNKLSIISDKRALSPEFLAINSQKTYETHVPIDFNNVPTYAYTNGTIKITVKNVGTTTLGLFSVYVAKADSVKYDNIYNLTDEYAIETINTLNGDPILSVGENTTIIIDNSDLESILPNIGLNDEIIVAVNAISVEGDTPKASDIGIFNAMINKPNISIIENLEGLTTSYIAANETGRLLIKNTGDKEVKLLSLDLNKTENYSMSQVDFLYGDDTLKAQECALISFDITKLKINKSNDVIVNLTTNATITPSLIKTFKAIVNNNYYNITIDSTTTKFYYDNENVIIKIKNNNVKSVTIDSIYINNTLIPLTNFIFNEGSSFTINAGNYITIRTTVYLIDINKKYNALARSKEGAENNLQKDSEHS